MESGDHQASRQEFLEPGAVLTVSAIGRLCAVLLALQHAVLRVNVLQVSAILQFRPASVLFRHLL